VSDTSYTAQEMMTVLASRLLKNDDVCFVGIGAPSAACNLARLTHAPNITLIYESGTIDTRPRTLPLSIGDGELCETALTTCSVPEMFRYWLQGGRMTVGFLGTAQIDRYANLNTTVVGSYEKPSARLPGAGGASEAGTQCREIFIIVKQSPRSFVAQLDFLTTYGHGMGHGARQRLGIMTDGPTQVISDLCHLQPDPTTNELKVVSLHPGVTRQQAVDATAWHLQFAERVSETPRPTQQELQVLRELKARGEV
jgi:glutaconate CoA-transferase subunit B